MSKDIRIGYLSQVLKKFGLYYRVLHNEDMSKWRIDMGRILLSQGIAPKNEFKTMLVGNLSVKPELVFYLDADGYTKSVRTFGISEVTIDAIEVEINNAYKFYETYPFIAKNELPLKTNDNTEENHKEDSGATEIEKNKSQS